MGLCDKNFGHLYLVGLADGRIKVGRSRNVRDRLRTHRRTHSVIWSHVFLLEGSGMFEWGILNGLKLDGKRIGRTEFCIGVTKSEVIALCREAIDRRIEYEEDAKRWEAAHREYARLLAAARKQPTDSDATAKATV